MATRAFWFTDTIVLAANGTGTLRLPVSAGEVGRLRRLQFIATGAFSIVGMQDDNSEPYTNANTNDPIPSTALNDAATDFSGITNLLTNIELQGPNALNIALLDTSAGSNTVRVIAEGEKEK